MQNHLSRPVQTVKEEIEEFFDRLSENIQGVIDEYKER
jgi:hypothetical protein